MEQGKQFLYWNKKKWNAAAAALFLAAVPMVCAWLYCAVDRQPFSQIYLPSSPWNDELFYYKMTENVLAYGYPQHGLHKIFSVPVKPCRPDIDNAYKINAVGPRNLSIAAAETGAKLMHISTDYVFPGTENRPLTEFDAVGPTSMYGKTKLAGEDFVREFSEKHFIIRTAWLYGDGKNFVKTMLRLAEDHREVNVVKDQFGTPTSASELAKAVKYLLPTENYGLFHGTCEGSCSWADFAAEIFRLAGKDTKVNYITTEEFASPTKRPAYSILDNYMLRLTTDFTFAPWQDAIEEYMRMERQTEQKL